MTGAQDADDGRRRAAVVVAALDRVVDDLAVALVDGDDSVAGEVELTFDARLLPAEATEGAWLQLRFEGASVVDVAVDQQRTEVALAAIEDRLAQIRSTQGGNRFGRTADRRPGSDPTRPGTPPR